jgi:hypothetical protein
MLGVMPIFFFIQFAGDPSAAPGLDVDAGLAPDGHIFALARSAKLFCLEVEPAEALATQVQATTIEVKRTPVYRRESIDSDFGGGSVCGA